MMEKKLIINHTDEYFMSLAIQEAQIAFDEEEVPVGAIITFNDRIIAKSHNQTELLNDCTAHAEMLCLTAAMNESGAKYLKDYTLYVTLEPCVMCAGALYWSQIGRIVYATSDIKHGYSLYGNLLHPTTEVLAGIMKQESESLLKQFFSELRK